MREARGDRRTARARVRAQPRGRGGLYRQDDGTRSRFAHAFRTIEPSSPAPRLTERAKTPSLPLFFSSSLVSSRVRVVLEGPADLDGTLYAIENGYEDACRARVFQFMVDELGFADADAAKAAWRPQFQNTTRP